MTWTLAALSDLHAGSTVAGMPKPIILDDGAEVHPSPLNTYLAGKLQSFYDRTENARTDKLAFLLNGDLTDGQVKDSAMVVSPHPHTEFAILKDMLDPIVRMKPDLVVVTRGTAAHVGKSGHKDEAAAHYLAKECGLPVQRDAQTGKYSHYLARFELAGHLIWATHHGSAGRVAWSNVLASKALNLFVELTVRGLRVPELVIQAHNHRFDDSYGKHPIRFLQQGAFQYKTDHAFKVVPTDVTDVGGYLVHAARGRLLEVERVQYFPDEPIVHAYD